MTGQSFHTEPIPPRAEERENASELGKDSETLENETIGAAA
jgi:hypothetical protein